LEVDGLLVERREDGDRGRSLAHRSRLLALLWSYHSCLLVSASKRLWWILQGLTGFLGQFREFTTPAVDVEEFAFRIRSESSNICSRSAIDENSLRRLCGR
jgi:hypothetical protein